MFLVTVGENAQFRINYQIFPNLKESFHIVLKRLPRLRLQNLPLFRTTAVILGQSENLWRVEFVEMKFLSGFRRAEPRIVSRASPNDVFHLR